MTHLSALPSSSCERMRTLRVNSYILLDSASFLAAPLSELVDDLARGGARHVGVGGQKAHEFKILDQSGLYGLRQRSEKHLLLRKGSYPYEYATSLELLEETKGLPDIGHFYSSLTNSTISETDYEHAKNVYTTFGCTSLLSYTKVYCETDVYLLCEVISACRKTFLNKFGLDMVFYISLPALAWDAMLLKTKARIELLTDIEMCLLLEQDLKGGVSFVADRYCEAGEVEMEKEEGDDQCYVNKTEIALIDANVRSSGGGGGGLITVLYCTVLLRFPEPVWFKPMPALTRWRLSLALYRRNC